LAGHVVELLQGHHRREPLSLGLGREEVREKLFAGADADVFKAVIASLVDEGKVATDRDALRLATHKPALSDAESAAKHNLEAAFRESGFQAGTLDETAGARGIPIPLARKLYNLLLAEKRVQRIGDFVYHVDVLEDLKSRVRSYKDKGPKIDVAVFKDITGGLTRKHAIPLLGYLDRGRITRRIGNEREIL